MLNEGIRSSAAKCNIGLFVPSILHLPLPAIPTVYASRQKSAHRKWEVTRNIILTNWKKRIENKSKTINVTVDETQSQINKHLKKF